MTALLGGFFVFVGWGLRNTNRSRVGRGVVTDGVVVGSRPGAVAGGDANVYAFPVVEFTTVEGETRRFVHQVGTTLEPRRGPVKVWYDPASPEEKPLIHGTVTVTAIPYVFLTVGVIALLVAAGILAAGLRR